jgi:hypothetical protein
MAPPSAPFLAESLRDAIANCHSKRMSEREAGNYYKVPSRAIRNTFEALSKVNDERVKFKQNALVESQERRQVYRWASKYTNATIPPSHGFTHWEMETALYDDVTGRWPQKFIVKEYGLSRMTLTRVEQQTLKKLRKTTVKEIRAGFKNKEHSKGDLMSIIKSV